MSSLAYVIRCPAHMMPPALYLSDEPGVVTLGIEGAVTTVRPSQPAELLQSGDTLRFKPGERLTYKQLLDVIIEAGKVITL